MKKIEYICDACGKTESYEFFYGYKEDFPQLNIGRKQVCKECALLAEIFIGDKNRLQEVVSTLLDVSDFIANKGDGLGYDIDREFENVKKLEDAAIYLSKTYDLIHSGMFGLIKENGRYKFKTK